MTAYRRKEAIGDATLYLGDCLEILPTLSATGHAETNAESVQIDAVMTDPPYNEVNRESGGLRALDKGGADSLPVSPCGLAQSFDMLGAKVVYIWCGTEQVSEYRKELVRLGWSTRQAVWWKTNPSPMNGQHLWLSAVELCVYGKKRGGIHNRECKHPVFRGEIARQQRHPTEKPIWLMTELVDASSCAGQTILDPFMGSGTTGVACANLGRKFIGIEIEEKYFEIACERIAAAYAQGRLFA